MPFSDPASGFFSPSMPNVGPEPTPSFSLRPLPNIENIGSPAAQPFDKRIQKIDYGDGDRTAAVAIKGIGEAANNAVTVADEILKMNVKEDVMQGIKTQLNSQIQAGFDTKELLKADQGKNDDQAPVGLSQGLERMNTLDKAKRYGPMSDSQFYASMGDLASQLKTRYPGYDDVISAQMKSVLGVDYREAMRTSLQADNDQLRKDQIASATKKQEWVNTHVKYFGDLPNWQNKPLAELQVIAAEKEGTEHTQQAEMARLALEQSKGKSIGQDATKSADWQLGYIGGNIWNSFQENAASKGFDIGKVVASGRFDSPKDQEAFIGVLREFSTAYERAGMDMYKTSITPLSDPSNTMGSAITERGTNNSKLQEILDNNNPFKRIIDAVGKNNMTLVGAETRMLTAQKDGEASRVRQQYPILGRLGAVNETLGPQLMQSVFGDKDTVNGVAKVVNQALLAADVANPGVYSDNFKEAVKKGTMTPTDWQSFIKNKTDAITLPTVPDATKEENARGLFLDHDPGAFLRSIKGTDQTVAAFNEFAGPHVYKSVSKMPADIRQGYQNWTMTNFESLYGRTADDIRSHVQNNPYYNLVIEDGHYLLQPTVEGFKLGDKYFQNTRAAQFSVNRLNSAIDTVSPAIANTGKDMNTYLGELNKELGLDNIPKLPGLNTESYGKKTTTQPTTTPAANPQGLTGLKGLIRKGEASGDYNNMFGLGNVGITNMTVDEVLDKQKAHVASGSPSSAAGGYQFIQGTLGDLKKQMSLSGSEKMTPELQDRMADTLLEKRGLSQYKAGKITKGQFVDNLSKEWRSLPMQTGLGFKSGNPKEDSINHPTVSLMDLLDSVNSL